MPEIRLSLQEADGGLPGSCMCCGEDATVALTRKMSWCPSWVAVFLLFGLLPYIVLALVMTKRATVIVPLCDQHKNHWWGRTLWILLSALGFMVVAIAGLGAISLLPPNINETFFPLMAIFCFVMFIAWIVIIVVAQNTTIRPKEITGTDITLMNISEQFVDIMQDEDILRERKRRGALRDDDDEDDDHDRGGKRRRTFPSDGIQE